MDLNLPLYIDKSIVSELNKKSRNIIKNEIIEVISYSLIDKITLFGVNLIFENVMDCKVINALFKSLADEIENKNNSDFNNSNMSNNNSSSVNQRIIDLCDKIMLTNMTPYVAINTPYIVKENNVNSKNNNNINNNVDVDINMNNQKIVTTKVFNEESFKLIKRCSFEIKDKSDISKINTIDRSNIDIMSAIIKNDQILDVLCAEANVEIINILCLERINFYIKKKNILSAIERDVFFEFNYTDLLNSNTRSNFVSNFSILFEITKGKNIIISSGSESFVTQRSPMDIIVLFNTLFNIKESIIKEMITCNPENAVRVGFKKKFYKNVIIFNKEDGSDLVDVKMK